MVEKIKRDVRITTIYEGTSEIQQNIIYLFRFRQIVRSKGRFYTEIGAGAAGARRRRWRGTWWLAARRRWPTPC